jgi:hypothetical protein
MKKQKEQKQVIDLDSFEEVSLWQLLPSGSGMGLSYLKTIVDSVHNGRAKLKPILISGQEGLNTTASAFIRALGIEHCSQTDASFLNLQSSLVQFFCTGENQAFLISNAEKLVPLAYPAISDILKKKRFSLFNFLTEGPDRYEVPGLVVMTSRIPKKIPDIIFNSFAHTIEIKDYTAQQLELVVLQRLKYAHIDYEDDLVLRNIVRYAGKKLSNCIWLLRTCISVIQSEGRDRLLRKDVIRAARLNRLPSVAIGDDIPF